MTAQAQIKASFPVRRMDFNFSDIPKYWFRNDPFLTHFMSNLSSLFPQGEFFFITAIRSVRDQVKDPALQKEISAFIGQESMHSKEHRVFNDYATAHGINVDALDRRIGKLLKLSHKIFSKKQQLAGTCALEHFTATIAAQLMKRTDINEDMRHGDPIMGKLWLWHSVEESEHKSVCYDTYQYLYKNSYITRVAFMAIAMAGLIAVITGQQVILMSEDKQLFNIKSWVKGLTTLWGRKGFMTEVLPEFFDYFRPGFHPEDYNSDALEQKYKEMLAL